jgi:hypothetical protein
MMSRISLSPGTSERPSEYSQLKSPNANVDSRGRSMSALGQKRTFCWAVVMSALHPKADIG